MVSLNFNDFFFLINPSLLIIFMWVFFFKTNSSNLKIVYGDTTNVGVIKINSNTTYISFYIMILVLTFIGIYTLHGKNSLVWFDHFNVNNFTIWLLYLFTFVGFSTFFLLRCFLKKTNLVKSVDYLFSINNLVVISPYLFFVNTVFTFLFLLEFLSAILLYKLISSKIWFKNCNKTKYINNSIPQNYINMVFFQYWVTFFSTIFIIYFYINIYYIFGTSDWFLVQYLSTPMLNNSHIGNNLLRLLIIIFTFSILFKLGITPFHLFKVEVYKGIPFLSVFFYTSYYFVVFFLFFIFLLSDFLSFFSNQYFLFLSLVLFFGTIYVTALLFDVTFLKVFFTYSTIINAIGFLIVFIAIL